MRTVAKWSEMWLAARTIAAGNEAAVKRNARLVLDDAEARGDMVACLAGLVRATLPLDQREQRSWIEGDL